jgi:flagellar protein FlaG
MVQDVTTKPDRLFPSEHTSPQAPLPPSQHDASGAPPHTATSATVEAQHVAQAVIHLSDALQKTGVELQMEVDADLNRVIVKIVDGQSGRLIRQIPAEDAVNLAKELKSLNGLLVQKHA